MKVQDKNSKGNHQYFLNIPAEYVKATGITRGMDFSYKINLDGSLLITPKKQE